MASQSASSNTSIRLELTETESILRRLLLDVAKYINADKPSELRFTGGWVRDKLLGVGSHDIDVAINDMTGFQFGLKMKEYLEQPNVSDQYGLQGVATTEESSKSQNAKDKNVVVTGLHKIEANPEKSKHLETVTTRIFGLDIDLVNLRKETYTEDSRNPQMEFGTPEEDALRRDATINAMFYNLQTEIVEDFTGQGHDDMRDKIIRTPLEPYQTFKDDPLRVLRLIRFASRLSYAIDDEAKRAMREPSIREALKAKISRERVGVELEKMLKGPDPRGALALIDELGLYDTTFTDPTTKIEFVPDHSLWRPSYTCLSTVLFSPESSQIKNHLFPDTEHEYIAWMLSNFTPWVDAPVPQASKPGGKPPPALAVNAAREGVKATNKICDILAACLRDHEEISNHKEAFIARRRSSQAEAPDDLSARDTLGMSIRRWGQTWRSQAMFTLMLERARSMKDEEVILQEWASWLDHVESLHLLNAYDLKPVIDGKALSSALGLRPGPWMKDALDVVMAWQLRNPQVATKEGAIEEVKKHQGELTSVLIRHFLTLTIRPLFSKKQARNVTATGRATMSQPVLQERFVGAEEEEAATRPWKNDPYAIDILRWVVKSLTPELAERHWPLLIPPILTLLDDNDLKYRTIGCDMVSNLLQTTPSSLLARTGLGPVFNDAITPCLLYLPTLTPETESRPLLEAAYRAVFILMNLQSSKERSAQTPHKPSPHALRLSRVLHSHIMPGISHIFEETPTLLPTLLVQLQTVLTQLEIDSINHIIHVMPILSEILADDNSYFIPSLGLETIKTLQILIKNCSLRIYRWRINVLKCVCDAWLGISNEQERWKKVKEATPVLDEAQARLEIVVDMLVSAVDATSGQHEEQVDLRSEIRQLVDADEELRGVFAKYLEST